MGIVVVQELPEQWFGVFEHRAQKYRLGPYPGQWQAREEALRRYAQLSHIEEQERKEAVLAAKAARRRERRQALQPLPKRQGPASQRAELSPLEARVGYRGVVPEGGGYVVKFKYNKERLNFGWFRCKHEAARVYDQQVSRLRGPLARLNFPSEENLAV